MTLPIFIMPIPTTKNYPDSIFLFINLAYRNHTYPSPSQSTTKPSALSVSYFTIEYASPSKPMAILLLRYPSILRPLPFALGLSTSLFATATLYRSPPLLCESASNQLSGSLRTYTEDAKVPVVRNGKMNPAAYKQISEGSTLGM